MWFLTDKGLQSYKDGSFTNHEVFANRDISEIYWDSDNTLLFTTAKENSVNTSTYNRFNTESGAVTSATKLDWSKAKHGIDFTYRVQNKNNKQLLIIEDEGDNKEYDFKSMIMDKIGDNLNDFDFLETVEVLCDSTQLAIVEDEEDKEYWEDLCKSLSEYHSFQSCSYEVGDTVFYLVKEVLLSDGSKRSINLNEYNEIPTGLKVAEYASNTISMQNEIGFQSNTWGNVSCWVYPSNEVCSDNLNFNYQQAAVDKDKTIYLKFNDHLVIYKDETFKAIPFDLTDYSFLLMEGTVYLTNNNTLLELEGTNKINTLYTSSVDCWVLGNQELQGFVKIEQELWMANCENVVRCIEDNCNKKRVEHPDSHFFELRSNAIEVVDNIVWIGYNTKGIYWVDWNDL